MGFNSAFKGLSICLDVAHPGVEVKGFNYLPEGGDSLLHVGICCKSLASQNFLRGPKNEKLLHHNEKPVS